MSLTSPPKQNYSPRPDPIPRMEEIPIVEQDRLGAVKQYPNAPVKGLFGLIGDAAEAWGQYVQETNDQEAYDAYLTGIEEASQLEQSGNHTAAKKKMQEITLNAMRLGVPIGDAEFKHTREVLGVDDIKSQEEEILESIQSNPEFQAMYISEKYANPDMPEDQRLERSLNRFAQRKSTEQFLAENELDEQVRFPQELGLANDRLRDFTGVVSAIVMSGEKLGPEQIAEIDGSVLRDVAEIRRVAGTYTDPEQRRALIAVAEQAEAVWKQVKDMSSSTTLRKELTVANIQTLTRLVGQKVQVGDGKYQEITTEHVNLYNNYVNNLSNPDQLNVFTAQLNVQQSTKLQHAIQAVMLFSTSFEFVKGSNRRVHLYDGRVDENNSLTGWIDENYGSSDSPQVVYEVVKNLTPAMNVSPDGFGDADNARAFAVGTASVVVGMGKLAKQGRFMQAGEIGNIFNADAVDKVGMLMNVQPEMAMDIVDYSAKVEGEMTALLSNVSQSVTAQTGFVFEDGEFVFDVDKFYKSEWWNRTLPEEYRDQALFESSLKEAYGVETMDAALEEAAKDGGRRYQGYGTEFLGSGRSVPDDQTDVKLTRMRTAFSAALAQRSELKSVVALHNSTKALGRFNSAVHKKLEKMSLDGFSPNARLVPLKEMLSDVEASSYNTLWGNSEKTQFKDTELTNMTIDQVLKFAGTPGKPTAYRRYVDTTNKKYKSKKDSSAPLGKYQFVPRTLKQAVDDLGMSYSVKFTPQVQDKLFEAYLHKRMRGVSTVEEGMNELRNAWAGLANVDDEQLRAFVADYLGAN